MHSVRSPVLQAKQCELKLKTPLWSDAVWTPGAIVALTLPVTFAYGLRMPRGLREFTGNCKQPNEARDAVAKRKS